MIKANGNGVGGFGRRTVLKGAASAAALLAAPALLTRRARAQATIGGEHRLEAGRRHRNHRRRDPGRLLPEPRGGAAAVPRASGVDVTLESTPPPQIRQKAILDLSSKTGTWATSATDPMYYPLYVSNGWIDPLTDFLDNPDLTDKAWFDYEDILDNWRGAATSIDGVPYGIPFEGEATIQIYRSDVYEKLGLTPAETLDDYAANAAKVNDPGNRLLGRGAPRLQGRRAEHVHLPVDLPRLRRQVVRRRQGRRQRSRSAGRARLVRRAPQVLGARGRRELELARHRRRLQPGHARLLHRHPQLRRRPRRPDQEPGRSARSASPAGPRARPARRVTSIWNWSFPINASVSDKEKAAAWLFIQWAGSKEVQAATSYGFDGAYKRLGVNRTSLWTSSEYTALLDGIGDRPHRDDHGLDQGGHRRRLAPARPAVGGARRDRGDGGPGSARRPGDATACARRSAGAGRRDHEEVSGGRGHDAIRNALAAGERRFAILLVSPALLVLLLTTTFPIVFLVWNSFQTINLAMPFLDGFAGLANYRQMMGDAAFWHSASADRDLHRHHRA